MAREASVERNTKETEIKLKLVLDGTPYEVFSQHETLKKVGLALPPVTQFTEELRQKGIGLPDTILSVEEAVNQIYAYLTGAETGLEKEKR